MTRDLARALAGELASAPYGGKETVLARWAEQTGLSRSTLLRHAKAAGYQPQRRKRRRDAGRPRCLDEEALSFLVALMQGSHRKTGSIEMPVTEALDICQRAGIIPREVSEFTVRRILRERGMSRRHLQQAYTTDGQTVSAHHVQLRSEHPNHLHQVDVSACLHWYFKKGGGLAYRHKALDLAGGKKAEPYRKLKGHILRYVLVDHKSAAFYVRYYYAEGETALNLIDFLWHSWRRREDPRDVFCGAPRMLYFDRGSANLAWMVGNLLDNLQVAWETHQAGVPRAKGSVETHNYIWQRAFESRLWLDPPRDLEELNARADDFRIHYCETRIHRRLGMTRFAAWSQIRDDQLRHLPTREVYNELVHERPHKTKVRSDKLVRWKGAVHLILSPVNVGEEILVVRNPYRLPELMVHRVNPDGSRGELLETRYLADPDEAAVPVGEYRRHADTPAQRAMKAASALDLEPLAEAAFGGYREELPANVTRLERRGETIQPPRQYEDKRPQAPGAAEASETPIPGARLRPVEPAPADPLPRPQYFLNLEHRYRWVRKRQRAGLPVSQEDLEAAAEFERTPEYQSMSREYWERDAQELRLAM